MLLRRFVANCIDLFVLIGGTAAGIYIAGLMNGMFEEPFTLLTVSQVCVIILIPIIIQSLFWMESTTIGKMMTFCEVETNDGEKLNYFAMLSREYLGKVLTCYIGCLPILFKKPGVHEGATNSRVIIKPAKKKVEEARV